jgi:hypothetical protein
VELEQGGQYEFAQQDIQPFDELEALKKKADDSCENCPDEKHTGIDRGKRKPHGKPR